MLVEFFGEPNDKILARAFIEADAVRLSQLLKALPASVIHLVNQAATHFPTSDDDFAGEETHRNELNQAIFMTDLMLEIIDVFADHKTVVPLYTIAPILVDAYKALRELQLEKDRTIARTRRMMGENFGSATGFHTTNYHEVADHIRDKFSEEG